MAALPPEARRWREQPASWCALDVLEHLLLAEQVVLGDVATAAARVAMVPTNAERFRAAIVWLVLRLGIRVRVPAEAMRPSRQGSFEELRTQWDAQHAALRQFATGLDARGRARRVFRHPIAGPLTTGQALQLLSAHLRTHQRQLDRLRTAWHAYAHASA
jgi:hypothetical protein